MDDGPHRVRLAGWEGDGMLADVAGFDARHRRELVVTEMGMGFGFDNPRVPPHGPIRAGFLHYQSALPTGIMGNAGRLRVQINTIRLGRDANGSGAFGFRARGTDCGKIGHARQSFNAHLPHVVDRQIGVQRFLDMQWLAAGVFHAQFQAERRADPYPIIRCKFTSPHRARRVAGYQTQMNLHGPIARWFRGHKFPLDQPGESVRRTWLTVLSRAEPWKTNRRTTAERFTRLEPAFGAHEQERLLSAWLKMRHVRPMQVDFRLGLRRPNRQAPQTALSFFHPNAVR